MLDSKSQIEECPCSDSSNSQFTNRTLVATTRPTRNQQHHLQFNFPEQEQTISQKQKQVRHVVLHDKETGNYAKQCRCTVTTNSNHKASKNKQDLQLCVKILVTPE